MKLEVFVVLLVSLSGTVAKGDANTPRQQTVAEGNADKPNIDQQLVVIRNMILGKHMKGSRFGLVTESFSMKDDKNYYDHIIDWSLQQLKLLKKEYPIEAIIKQRGKHSSEMPVEGTVIFDGLHSLRTRRSRENKSHDHTTSKRLENGDQVLKEIFELGNISGIGKFSGHKSQKEGRNNVFQFHPAPTYFYLSFLITNDPSSKDVTFEFDQFHPQYFEDGKPHVVESRESINVTLILEKQALNTIDRLFKDLNNIIYQRLTAHKDNPNMDTVLDNVLNKILQNARPFKLRGEGSISNRTAAISNWWNLTFDALHSLTRLSKVQIMNEMNGDPDFQTRIKFGNVSGNGRVFHQTPEVTFNETFTFTSHPVEVEAFFYLPRNRSFLAKGFHFLNKPSYTIQPQNERFRSVFQQLLEKHGPTMYPQALYRILKQTHNEVFPKTNFNQTNKNAELNV